MTEWWQTLPLALDPIAVSFGSFTLRWYAVFFLFGWAAASAVLFFRGRKETSGFSGEIILDIAIWSLAGAIIGGRLGYALFYDALLFLHPVSLFSPFDPISGEWTGIRGMSFYGALIGVALALLLVSYTRGIRFLALADFVVPVVPIALFFGRMGNFFNLELAGRPTGQPWGMHFPSASGASAMLCHPSQLYEAGFEGLLLFGVLFFLRRRTMPVGLLSFLFVLLYGASRFLLEFFRLPDPGSPILFGWMTVGQVLSAGAVIFALFGIAVLFLIRRKYGKIGTSWW